MENEVRVGTRCRVTSPLTVTAGAHARYYGMMLRYVPEGSPPRFTPYIPTSLTSQTLAGDHSHLRESRRLPGTCHT